MAQDKTDPPPAATPTTPAIWAANEWGIPDWREPATYGDVKRWSTNRWRWEFYRRRDDLRDFFDRWAESTAERNLGCNIGKKPNEPGFLAFGSDEDASESVRRFGYAGVPNPRIGEQKEITIMPFEEFSRRNNYFNPQKRRQAGFSVLKALGEKEL